MLIHVDGFDHLQGQSDATLLSSLAAGGYTSSAGMGMAAGRKLNTYAVELQVSPGTAGESWSQRANTIPQAQRGVATNAAGRWTSVGDAGSAATTTDGVTWTPLILGTAKNMKAITCDGAVWITVGDGGAIYRSTDGRNYTAITAPISTVNLRAIATDGSGSWLAVGANGAAGAIFRSTDGGLTWDNIVVASMLTNLSALYANNQWMVGGNTGQLMTSPDMTTWTKRTFGATTSITGIAFGDNQYLAVTANNVRRSLDNGVTWIVATATLIPSGVLNAIAFADSRWIAVGDGGNMRMTDDDAVTWSTPSTTGLGALALYALAVARGTQVGWTTVGNKTAGTHPTATIFMSLAPPTNLTRVIHSTGNRLVIGFAHNSTARGRILSIGALIEMDWPAAIELLGVQGTAIPAKNVWYYYELVLDKLANTVSLYINNTLDIVAPLSGLSTINDFAINWIAENGAISRVDDVYILDDTSPAGETLVNRLGPIQVPIRMPTADATPNAWTGSSPGPHYPLIGLLPPSTESYIRSNASGDQDLFTSTAALPAGAGTTLPIFAVGVMALAQKGDIDNRQIGLVVGAPGTQNEVVDTQLSITPEYSYAIFEKAPGGAAWDATNTLSTPFGVVVRP